MPPRKKQRAATAEATQQPDRDTLIRCFLWEIAQALKGSYLTSTYNVRQKITFARDYSLLVPIDVLRNAALAKFAHPLQRLLAQLSMILFRLPDVAEQLIIHEVFFSRWHPESMLNGKPRGDCLFNSLREVKAACEEFFISDPVQAGNKLTMRLPKDSEKLPSGGRSGSLLAQQARLVQRVLSSLPPAMHRRWWRDHAAGLAPLIQAAEAAITHASMANVLNLPPPVDATAPHSLELMVKLQSREGTSRALAVITVASDLAVTDLVNLCTHEFEDLGDLSSWTYLIVKDPHAKAKFIAARGNDEMVARLMRAREVGHMTQEQMREVGHMTHEQMQLLLPPVSDANEAPIIHDVVVRIWAIESAKFPGCYSGYGSRGEDDEELPAKRVEQTADGSTFEFREALGGRAAIIRKAIERADVGVEDSGENHSDVHRGLVHVMFDCALSDVLPTPKERWPSMEEFIAEPERYSHGVKCTIDWNHWGDGELEVFALRRLPRMAPDLYPIVRRVNALPQQNYVLEP